MLRAVLDSHLEAEYDCPVIGQAVRGVFRVTAAVTGLLLVYGFVFAMEGMTVRVAMSSARELAITTAWMLPWTVLFCSGFGDLAIAARHDWVFWGGTVLILSFVYYFERNTTSSTITKAAMPLLATAGGVMPRIFRRLRLVYAICSVVAGVAGVIAAYRLAALVLSGSSFATRTIGALMVGFCIASIATGFLAVFSPQRRLRRYQHT